jgi:hypothetical protein
MFVFPTMIAPAFFELFNTGRVFARNPRFEILERGGCFYPGGIVKIFNGDGNAVQGPLPPPVPNFRLGCFCLF